jgi:hypothetical protein
VTAEIFEGLLENHRDSGRFSAAMDIYGVVAFGRKYS